MYNHEPVGRGFIDYQINHWSWAGNTCYKSEGNFARGFYYYRHLNTLLMIELSRVPHKSLDTSQSFWRPVVNRQGMKVALLLVKCPHWWHSSLTWLLDSSWSSVWTPSTIVSVVIGLSDTTKTLSEWVDPFATFLYFFWCIGFILHASLDKCPEKSIVSISFFSMNERLRSWPRNRNRRFNASFSVLGRWNGLNSIKGPGGAGVQGRFSLLCCFL